MKILAFVVVAVGLLVGAVAWFLPATLIDREIDRATQGKVRLAEASGTVWDGRGVLTDAGGTWRVPVAFSIDKADVLRGSHVVTLRPVEGASTPRGTIEVVGSGVRVRDLAVDAPAQAATALAPTRVLPTLGGTLSLSAPQFEWTGQGGSGALALKWTGARLVMGDAMADLGTVDAALSPQGGRLAGRLANAGGDVRIDGTVSIGAGDASVEGTLAPAPGASPAIARALATLGTPDASGAVRVSLRGALR